MEHRRDIDGLRAIAVLAVIVFHSFPAVLPAGYLGVDVFFVISGYLISNIIFTEMEIGKFSFVRFYQRRIRRIFPALVIVLLATWAAGYFLMSPAEFRVVGKNIFAGASFWSNIALYFESNYFDQESALKPLLHLWSIGVEEQFYLLLPILLLSTRKWKALVAPLIVALLIGSLSLAIWRIQINPAEAFFMPHIRAWELLCGVLLALYQSRITSLSNSPLAAGFFAIAFFMLLISLFTPGPTANWYGLLPTVPIFATMVLLGGRSQSWVNRIMLSSPILVWIGRISYPLYLWHWPLLAFARIVNIHKLTQLQILALIAMAFLLAQFTYSFVEFPIRFGEFKKRINIAIFILSASMAACCALGIWTMQDGLSFRVPAELTYLIDHDYDRDKGIWFRHGTCFIVPEEGQFEFANNCADPNFATDPHNVLVWGDSYAGMLYPGLLEMKKKTSFSIAEYAAGGCLPVEVADVADSIEVQRACNQLYRTVMLEIRNLRPKTVILYGLWMRGRIERLANQLEQSIERIKEAGVKKIILLGPPPYWDLRSPVLLYQLAMHDPRHRIPERSYLGFNSQVWAIDMALKAIAEKHGITFLSPLTALCNVDGCETMVGNEIMQIDPEHLSKAGSIYLVDKLLKDAMF